MAFISSADRPSSLVRTSSRLSTFSGIDSQLVRCDIVFGMPSQDCRGTGICKLTSDFEASFSVKKDCRHTVTFVGRTEEGSQIVLVFFRELLCVDLFRHHFRRGMLEMTEPCPLPADLTAVLGLKGAFLMPGKYQIQEQEGCFRVNIQCGL